MTTTALYDYRAGAEPLAAIGRMRAFGKRILCRAILEADWYRGPIQVVTYNAHDAVAFEILSVGRGVAGACEEMGEDAPTVGQHCDIRSVAADRVHAKDPTGRYWLVDIADVAGLWDPVPVDTPGLIEACAAIVERQALAAAAAPPSNGEVEMSPR